MHVVLIILVLNSVRSETEIVHSNKDIIMLLWCFGTNLDTVSLKDPLYLLSLYPCDNFIKVFV